MNKLHFLTLSFGLFISLFSQSQIAFFYQTVGPFMAGSGYNTVEIGTSSDGINIRSNSVSALDFYVGPSADSAYGDPVFSYLPNGNWAVTSWTGPGDPRGQGNMLYYEATCPIVVDTLVNALAALNCSDCLYPSTVQSGKTSQLFEVSGRYYVMHSNASVVRIACLSDGTNGGMDLPGIYMKDSAYSSLSALNYGESMPVFTSDSLRLSDCAIAHRTDGTWVLFVKGISDTTTASSGSLEELEARGIYRTTTTDFINWTPLEKVVGMASVPEATQTSDGKVWLYWQDFTDAIAAGNLSMAARAPISGAYELATYELSTPQQVFFEDEAFETNNSLHYATNGNPIFLPDTSAFNALRDCVTAAGDTWNTAGINDNASLLENSTVFPNPNQGVFTIQFVPQTEPVTVALYNLAGEIVFAMSVTESLKEVIDVRQLPKGAYFLTIQESTQVVTKKVIIE